MIGFKNFIKENYEINEDGVAMVGGNVASSGLIAGLGIDNPKIPDQAEPGINKNKKKTPITFKMFKRKS